MNIKAIILPGENSEYVSSALNDAYALVVGLKRDNIVAPVCLTLPLLYQSGRQGILKDAEVLLPCHTPGAHDSNMFSPPQICINTCPYGYIGNGLAVLQKPLAISDASGPKALNFACSFGVEAQEYFSEKPYKALRALTHNEPDPYDAFLKTARYYNGNVVFRGMPGSQWQRFVIGSQLADALREHSIQTHSR